MPSDGGTELRRRPAHLTDPQARAAGGTVARRDPSHPVGCRRDPGPDPRALPVRYAAALGPAGGTPPACAAGRGPTRGWVNVPALGYARRQDAPGSRARRGLSWQGPFGRQLRLGRSLHPHVVRVAILVFGGDGRE